MFRANFEYLGSGEVRTMDLELHWLSSARPTLRTLIEEAVSKECAAQSENPPAGSIKARQMKTLEQFSSGTFAVFVDGKPMKDLDAVIPDEEPFDVTFIRIMPLVGG